MSIDYQNLDVGEKLKLPSQRWDNENKAIYYSACEHSAKTGKQFQIEDDGIKYLDAGRDFYIVRIR